MLESSDFAIIILLYFLRAYVILINPVKLYQNGQSEMLSRTSLSTRSSGLNMNQLSARSDCEPLLLSNLSTPNNYNTVIITNQSKTS